MSTITTTSFSSTPYVWQQVADIHAATSSGVSRDALHRRSQRQDRRLPPTLARPLSTRHFGSLDNPRANCCHEAKRSLPHNRSHRVANARIRRTVRGPIGKRFHRLPRRTYLDDLFSEYRRTYSNPSASVQRPRRKSAPTCITSSCGGSSKVPKDRPSGVNTFH